MILRWLFSSTVRQFSALLGHVRKLRNAQCDALSPQALQAFDAALRESKAALASGADNKTLGETAANLENAANKWLLTCPIPNGARTWSSSRRHRPCHGHPHFLPPAL